jgi:hypothetical protein
MPTFLLRDILNISTVGRLQMKRRPVTRPSFQCITPRLIMPNQNDRGSLPCSMLRQSLLQTFLLHPRIHILQQ